MGSGEPYLLTQGSFKEVRDKLQTKCGPVAIGIYCIDPPWVFDEAEIRRVTGT